MPKYRVGADITRREYYDIEVDTEEYARRRWLEDGHEDRSAGTIIRASVVNIVSNNDYGEPWTLGQPKFIDGSGIWYVPLFKPDCDDEVAEGIGSTPEEATRNAKRVLSCVNACAKLDPAAIKYLMEAVQDVVDVAEEDVDLTDLLAKVKKVLNDMRID